MEALGAAPTFRIPGFFLSSQEAMKNKFLKINWNLFCPPAASLASLPRLGELWVTDATPDALSLSWTVPEGHFDSFVVQFKSKDGPQVVPVEGHARSVTVSSLDAGRKYRFLLYGLLGRKRLGPLTADGTTGEGQQTGSQSSQQPLWSPVLRSTQPSLLSSPQNP